jgi:hypothetical protein
MEDKSWWNVAENQERISIADESRKHTIIVSQYRPSYPVSKSDIQFLASTPKPTSLFSININPMHPHLLFNPRTIRTNPHNPAPLVDPKKQRIPRHPPPNSLRTRRTRQTPFIRPKLIKYIDLLQSLRQINLHLYSLLRIETWDGRA